MNFDVSHKKVKTFFQQYPVVIFKPRTIIIGPNNLNLFLFYIKTGMVKLFATNLNGENFNISLIKDGVVFPLYQVLSKVKPNYYYTSINELTVHRIPISEFYQFLEENPNCLFYFNKLLIDRTYILSQRIELFMISKIEDRLRFLLIFLAKTIGEQKDGKLQLMLPLSHAELASWVHSTRESVSRSLSQLKKQKLVEMNGKYIVLNDAQFLEEKFM